MTPETAHRTRAHARTGVLKDAGRRIRLAAARLDRLLPLSLRFLILAVVVVALAMLVLGSWIGHYLQASISQGIAVSWASTVDSLVSNRFTALPDEGPISPADRATLDMMFEVGSEADSTRLLHIRVWRRDNWLLYESEGSLVDPISPEDFRAAAERGEVTSRVMPIPLEAVGPIESHTLRVLRIYTPLHRSGSDEVFGVAALYYSAQSLLDIQFRALVNVWIVAGLIGLGVIGVLYLVVDRASRTVARQRARLARNLVASRRLSREVHALHAASERLRLDATSANESLLAQVGSDIHDGPIQLLTLIILRLSKAAAKVTRGLPHDVSELHTTIQLATETMEELRNISTGLVLPELTPLSLGDAIGLAISRHEEATGARVGRLIGPLPDEVSMAVKICAYRIIQEALNNAFRHAAAPDTAVAASSANGRLVVRIENPTRHKVAPGDEGARRLGLRGMRFRVESLGGVLRADVGASPVSRVEAEIPYRTEQVPLPPARS
ncbi:sensor histidine kinase [Devosia sp.]|uniref:sensor histidine kinase n=1 Tax=Devosia sp. TaxID=1871048 RepID=UPI002EFFD901